jgi:hypothetical protein
VFLLHINILLTGEKEMSYLCMPSPFRSNGTHFFIQIGACVISGLVVPIVEEKHFN